MDAKMTSGVVTNIINSPTRWERYFFAAFLFLLPFQARIFLADLRGTSIGLPDWTDAWLWASDLALGALLVFWVRRGVALRDLRPLGFLLLFVPTLFVNPTALTFSVGIMIVMSLSRIRSM